MRLTFSGNRALIVGGSCDLGLALGEALASEGMMPILTYRNDAGKRRIETHMQGAQRKFESLTLDFASPDACSVLAGHLERGVDYMIDLVQEDFEALVASADPDAARRFFQNSISARSEMIYRVSRKMVAARRGRMVYISSTAAARANPGQGFYAAAKQAAEALYRNIGLELAQRGVTAVALRPGYIDAGRGRRYLREHRSMIAESVPLGRALSIQEVVETIMFLLSDSAAGFNATSVTMDGGLSAGK